MNALMEVIARTVREHFVLSWANFGAQRCGCGFFGTQREHSGHVAEQVEAALGIERVGWQAYESGEIVNASHLSASTETAAAFDANTDYWRPVFVRALDGDRGI